MDSATGVTLDQILMLTGRLDDALGFDSARERYRRFLLDHVREPAIARVLIEECQHAPGDQAHRALQDLIVLLGRFLGFHVRFGHSSGYGQWHSPGLSVLVDVRADGTAGTDLTALASAVKALATPSAAIVGLCVTTPLCVGRAALESAASPPIAVVTLNALLSVTALASAGRATHQDVVRLLTSTAPLGFIMALLERCADDRVLRGSGAQARVVRTGFWILRVAGARGTSPEEFIEIIVGKRHVLGLAGDRAANDAVQPGDRLCFAIAGKGVVGHGRVAALDATQPSIRDAHRFRHLWRVEDVHLYVTAPIPVDVETELRLRAAGDSGRDGQTIVSISRESFDRMTAPAPEASPDAADRAPRLAG